MHACEWVRKEPLYIKAIGNMKIDPSEFENENGAFLAYKEIPCRYVTDPGKKFCPRHELEAVIELRRAFPQPSQE